MRCRLALFTTAGDDVTLGTEPFHCRQVAVLDVGELLVGRGHDETVDIALPHIEAEGEVQQQVDGERCHGGQADDAAFHSVGCGAHKDRQFTPVVPPVGTQLR